MNSKLVRSQREFGEFIGEPLCVAHKFGGTLEGGANGSSTNREWIQSRPVAWTEAANRPAGKRRGDWE